MTPLLLAQLAHVAYRDAEAIADSYAWPPRPPLTDDELAEIRRLMAIADELSEHARAAGQTNQGTDALFGRAPSDPLCPHGRRRPSERCLSCESTEGV